MREPPAAGTAHRIDRLPRNEHGHDRGLAGAGRELERQPSKAGVRLLVGRREMVEESAALVAERRRDLGQPDRAGSGAPRFGMFITPPSRYQSAGFVTAVPGKVPGNCAALKIAGRMCRT